MGAGAGSWGADPQLSDGFDESRCHGALSAPTGKEIGCHRVFRGGSPRCARRGRSAGGSGKLVLTLISDITGSRRHGYIGIDNLAAGRTAAYLLASTGAAQRGQTGDHRGHPPLPRAYRARVGFSGIDPARSRASRICRNIRGQDDPLTNMKMTLDLLERHPDLRGIYNVGGSSEGIGMALTRTGRAGDVRLIGHGFGPDTRRMLQGGIMTAVLTQRTQSLLEVMLDQLHAKSPPQPLPMQIIFRPICLRNERGGGRQGARRGPKANPATNLDCGDGRYRRPNRAA